MGKWIPILVIVILMAAAFILGVPEYLSFDSLKSYRETLLQSVETHPILAPFLYVLVYVGVVALSLPGATLLTLIGGFLFGIPWGAVYVLFGATIGATLLFLAARSSLGNFLRKKGGPKLQRMEKGFQKNVASYLLFLRFIPLFPFWLVNIAPAFFNVSLRTYMWTTVIGIAPGAYIYTQVGSGLGAIFESGEAFTLHTVFNTKLQIALFLLALFSLIPILVKKFRHDRQ